jgi:hypothetical protein
MDARHLMFSSVTDFRPWLIVLIQIDAPHSVIARFRNRQDANDQLRALQRFMPTTQFEVIFEPPEESISD